MSHYTYLCSLLAVIGLLVITDGRYKLAFFANWRQTAKVLGTAMLFFLAWDSLGVRLKIFYPDNSAYALHVMVLPGVPVEEGLFLFLFTYLTLLLWRGCVHLRLAQ